MKPPRLFAYFGIELEYMIVADADLAVRPWADRVLLDPAGQITADIERGPITWSNELVAHVIELKTTRPEADLRGLAARFASEVVEINRQLAVHGARLLPGAMHPTMRPEESMLWPHEANEIYATFDRIFDCRGHGWSNLQSVHLNLPFANDAEFARLHAAIRLMLPLLPALAASSPFVEGSLTGTLDNRLAFYRGNSARLPTLAGRVIPEPVYTQADYEKEIYAPIGRELAPHDPAGILEPRFSNSRGAIARFDRNSIEIRLLDIQECPAADLAILRTIIALLRDIVSESQISLTEQQAVPVSPLRELFDATVEKGGDAIVTELSVLRACGIEDDAISAADLWRRVMDRLQPGIHADPMEQAALQGLIESGTLAQRITQAHNAGASVPEIYRELAGCLQHNRLFQPASTGR